MHSQAFEHVSVRETKPLLHRAVLLPCTASMGTSHLACACIINTSGMCVQKAENLLGDLRDPHNPVVKIADMGLSKRKAATTVSGNMRGTLPWMAPELFPSTHATEVPACTPAAVQCLP